MFLFASCSSCCQEKRLSKKPLTRRRAEDEFFEKNEIRLVKGQQSTPAPPLESSSTVPGSPPAPPTPASPSASAARQPRPLQADQTAPSPAPSSAGGGGGGGGALVKSARVCPSDVADVGDVDDHCGICSIGRGGDESDKMSPRLHSPVIFSNPFFSAKPTLTVPSDFVVERNEALTNGSLDEEGRRREMQRLQNIIKEFVREALSGVWLDFLDNTGSVVPAFCTIDRSLTVLSIQAQRQVKQLDIVDVLDVLCGDDGDIDLGHDVPGPMCCTLILRNAPPLSFQFSDIRAREHFGTCMKVLRLALETPEE
ncbi:unnamed protein product [Vitrella brassicaformis CCMP3155]|uniref:Uncharacterized protein n=1 Tax=Vitrella brassicaformis (strain CCMP3155) TaxID=1169540 RepID=A0A0G4H728_VITBC|nr:unnamed protein product [Vitrella brassicaformis CCMP3155]|eukprot:CEM39508.1 unnamed protein product [Vitrella brassicaformis CCMP3155]